MWQFVKDLWIACLFIIGVREKQTPLLPTPQNSSRSVLLEVSLDEQDGSFMTSMHHELIKARKEVIKPLSDEELEKLINNFLDKELPAEYKKYLSDPVGNIGGNWIIITHYSFDKDRRVMRQVLPVIIDRLKQLKIRAEDRAKNGYLWINAEDLTAAVESWEKLESASPSLYRQLYHPTNYK